MLSWQDSSVLAHLRLMIQEHSGWRRTQHHLKAQLHRSSFSSSGTKHPTKPEAFCRRAPFLTKPRAHLQYVFPPSYILLLGYTLDSGRTQQLYMMTSVYSQRHFVLQGVDRRVRKKAPTQAILWLSNLPSGVCTGTATLFHKEKHLHSSTQCPST